MTGPHNSQTNRDHLDDHNLTETETTVPDIEITPNSDLNIDPESKLLMASDEPQFIYTSPRPGLEALGIVINDPTHGPYTLLLTPAQAAFIVHQLIEGLGALDTIRLEHDYHHPGETQ